MLPICRPVNPSVLLVYALNEMSQAPQTKNCMKFITVRRNRMLMPRSALFSGLVFLEERGADPAHEAHEDRREEGGPEAADRESGQEGGYESEHRGIDHEQEQAERQERRRQRQQHDDRPYDRVDDAEEQRREDQR